MLKVEFEEKHGWTGLVTVTVRDRRGEIVEREEFWNLITNAGKNHVRDSIAGTVTSKIGYVAVGSASTAPSTSDTALGTEQFRKQVTSRSVGGTGALTTTVYIAPNEANVQIEEIGWFAGAATGTPGSGTLISRVLYSHLKNALESIQIDRTDTFS